MAPDEKEMRMDRHQTDNSGLADLLAALSLAIDLGLGQPMENFLRTSLLAVRLGKVLGVSEQNLMHIYYLGYLDSHSRRRLLHQRPRLVLRALAHLPPSGHLVEVDQSPLLVAVAQRLVTEDGVNQPIEFRVGDVHHLAVGESGLDAVIATHG